MVTKLNDQQKEFAGYLAELLQAPAKGEVAEHKQDPVAEKVPVELVALHEWLVRDGTVAPSDDEVITVRANQVKVMKRSEMVPVPMQQGLGSLTAGLDRSIPFDIPLASIFVGGLGGLVLGDVIDGFAAPRGADGKLNLVNVGIKGAAIALAFHPRFGKRYLGDKPAMVLGVVLAIGLLGDILPIDQWVAKLTGQVSRILPHRQNPTGLDGHMPSEQGRELRPPEYDQLATLLGGR